MLRICSLLFGPECSDQSVKDALFAGSEPTLRPKDVAILLQVLWFAEARPWHLLAGVCRGSHKRTGHSERFPDRPCTSETGSEIRSIARRCQVQGIISDGDAMAKKFTTSGESRPKSEAKPPTFEAYDGRPYSIRAACSGLEQMRYSCRVLARPVSTHVAPCVQVSR